MAESEASPKKKIITLTGVRNIALLGLVAYGGYWAWKKFFSKKADGGAPDQAGPDAQASVQTGTSATATPQVKTLVDTDVARQYAGTLASPIVLPMGPAVVQAGKSYASPSIFMTSTRKVGTKRQPLFYSYTPILSTRTATGVGTVRQFIAPVAGIFTGTLLTEGGKLWAEIKTA